MRGNRRQMIFLDDEDYAYMLATTGAVVVRDGWRLIAYVFMGNHLHLLVETIRPTISKGMHRLATRYVQWFNQRHGYEGHLFERRFRSRLVETEAQLFETARYIALNPVRAGMCAKPQDWRWSSYAASVGLVHAPAFLDADWLPKQFGIDLAEGRRAYAEYVHAGLPQLPAALGPWPLRPRLV